MSSGEPVYRLRPGAVAWSSDDGETIGLDLSRSSYLGINRSGSLLWAALADGATRAQLVDQLATTFELPRPTAEQDVDAFLTACREHGYLTTDG
jgi:hypothetical protein